MKKPIIVAGCGRSGTHWLGNIFEQVMGEDKARFEPPDPRQITEVVVDSRLRHRIRDFAGHRIIHLVRDGRDVVRSLDQWYRNTKSFAVVCKEWTDAVDSMAGYPIVRVEDLNSDKAKDATPTHIMSHWTEWDDAQTEEFWDLCGPHMKRMGYER